mgnify:CR=1 FL=1
MAKRKQTAAERAQDEADRPLLVQNALRTRRLAEKAQAELDAKAAERLAEVPGEQPLALGVDLATDAHR